MGLSARKNLLREVRNQRLKVFEAFSEYGWQEQNKPAEAI
jgi:hypothetical protein